MSAAFWFMISVVGTAMLSFLTVAVWLSERTKERDAHYRHETIRKLAEAGDSAGALEYLRETERSNAAGVRSKARLAGLITLAAGVALTIFLHQSVPGTAAYLVGLIPLLVGVAFLIFTEIMAKPRS
jgi:Domain of unknown function (DUF6249)